MPYKITHIKEHIHVLQVIMLRNIINHQLCNKTEQKK